MYTSLCSIWYCIFYGGDLCFSNTDQIFIMKKFQFVSLKVAHQNPPLTTTSWPTKFSTQKKLAVLSENVDTEILKEYFCLLADDIFIVDDFSTA